MNDKAREVLVEAALRGHKQGKDFLHDTKEQGDCVLGVLHLSLHGWNRNLALVCAWASGTVVAKELLEAYDVTGEGWKELAHCNDKLGWDLLTIARKA